MERHRPPEHAPEDAHVAVERRRRHALEQDAQHLAERVAGPAELFQGLVGLGEQIGQCAPLMDDARGRLAHPPPHLAARGR